MPRASYHLYFLILGSAIFNTGCNSSFDPDTVFEVGINSKNILIVENVPVVLRDDFVDYDLDNDGNADITFSLNRFLSSGGNNKETIGAATKNDRISFVQHTIPDTIRECICEINDSTQNTYIYNSFSSIECEVMCQGSILQDSILRTETDQALGMFEKGEGIAENDLWGDGAIIRETDNSGFELARTRYFIIKGEWGVKELNDNNGYLIFRYLLDNGEYRYGWVKLGFEDDRHLIVNQIAHERLN